MKKFKTFQAHDPKELDDKMNKWMATQIRVRDVIVHNVTQSTTPDEHTRASLITVTILYEITPKI